MYFAAKDIYQKLIDADIHDKKGEVVLKFMEVNARVLDKSATGNLLQEWLGNWLTQNNIDFRAKENTQEPPDFFLNETRDDIDWLEIKTFDVEGSANFDVANFDSYRRSLLTQAYRLDADYLIFAYKLDSEGSLTIPKMWLKKIWEITGASERYPLKCQVKQDVIHNIRPVTWYSDSAKYEPFESRLQFVEALYQTIKQYDSDIDADKWLEQVKTLYAEQVGRSL